MSSPLPIPPPGFDQLSRADQLDYVDEFLDYVTANAEIAEVPEWHHKIVDERLARYREFGMEETTWEEFEQELDEEFFSNENLA
jgi:hypothetical protein